MNALEILCWSLAITLTLALVYYSNAFISEDSKRREYVAYDRGFADGQAFVTRDYQQELVATKRNCSGWMPQFSPPLSLMVADGAWLMGPLIPP